MAIEHFDEKIASNIKKNLYAQASTSFSNNSMSDSALELFGESMSPTAMAVILQGTPGTSSICSTMEANRNRNKFSKLFAINKMAMKNISQITKQHKMQHKQIKKQNDQLVKYYNQMKEMKRRLDELEIKNRELSAKFDVTMPNTEVASNIRPRTSNIVLKRRLEKD